LILPIGYPARILAPGRRMSFERVQRQQRIVLHGGAAPCAAESARAAGAVSGHSFVRRATAHKATGRRKTGAR